MRRERARRLVDSRREEGGERQLWANEGPGGTDWELVLGGVFIMATYNGPSSEALVADAVRRHGGQGLRVLIGGLGLAFSVKAACALGAVAHADVVELDPVVIRWNRTLLRDVNGHHLDDPKVTVLHDDFLRYVRETPARYDILCMDIDNGPMLLANAQNAQAYEQGFFARVQDVLLPGGLFSIWSCNPDDGLLRDMAAVFDDCRVTEVAEDYEGKPLHSFLYTGQRRGGARGSIHRMRTDTNG